MMKEQRFNSFFLSLLFSFVGILLPLQAFAQDIKAYGVLSKDGKIFTIRYDEYKTDSVRLFEKGIPKRVQKVIFEASFKEYRPTSTFYLFGDCKALKEIDGIAYLNTEQVTDMRGMFSGCRSLTSLDLSNFNTKQVTDMSCMFEDCSSLKSLNLSNFNTEQVIDMCSMFNNCSSLISLDLSNFNAGQRTSTLSMFWGCSNLRTIFCRNSWENTNNLFYINPKLKGAAVYAPEKGGGDMANPHTGYFTLPGK